MVRKLCYILFVATLSNCGSHKRTVTRDSKPSITVSASKETKGKGLLPSDQKIPYKSLADDIIKTALTYSGTRYKFGGTTKKGMDCSGLLYVSFAHNNITLPRISRDMAKHGKRVRKRDIEKGDLLFFKTSKRNNRINHVGLVVEVIGDDIRFIHASTSRGVIVSSLREGYWDYAFVMANRVL